MFCSLASTTRITCTIFGVICDVTNRPDHFTVRYLIIKSKAKEILFLIMLITNWIYAGCSKIIETTRIFFSLRHGF